MTKTGVFATKEETEELFKLAEEAGKTPVIAMSSADALSGRGFASTAWERVKKRCHELALAHGLPEIEGYYGATRDGEFVKT